MNGQVYRQLLLQSSGLSQFEVPSVAEALGQRITALSGVTSAFERDRSQFRELMGGTRWLREASVAANFDAVVGRELLGIDRAFASSAAIADAQRSLEGSFASNLHSAAAALGENTWLDAIGQSHRDGFALSAEASSALDRIRDLATIATRLEPFDRIVNAQVEALFGQWRGLDPGALQAARDIDLRFQLYEAVGLDSALYDIPAEYFHGEFEETDDAQAATESAPSQSVAEAEADVEPVKSKFAPPSANITAYSYVFAVEAAMRFRVYVVLMTHYGDQWISMGVPPRIVQDLQEQAPQGTFGRELLDWSHLGQLKDIVLWRRNKKLFQPVIPSRRAFDEAISRLVPLRNDVAHTRRLLKPDAVIVAFECQRLLRVLEVPDDVDPDI